MAKPREPVAGTATNETASTHASGGAPTDNRSRNRSTASPSTSTTTPPESFITNPDRPSSSASPNTYGRNPTPCTTPETRARTRIQASSTSVWYALACASWMRGMC
jgi:hypothetical protein